MQKKIKVIKVRKQDAATLTSKNIADILSVKIKEFSPQIRKELTTLKNLLRKDDDEARFYFEKKMSKQARFELQIEYPFLYDLIKSL